MQRGRRHQVRSWGATVALRAAVKIQCPWRPRDAGPKTKPARRWHHSRLPVRGWLAAQRPPPALKPNLTDTPMDAVTNALLLESDHDMALPAFERIRPEDFEPAFTRALHLHRDELSRIAQQTAAPDFDNTVAAFDRAGALLQRIEAVFHSLTASATTPALQAVQRQMAAPLAAHWSAVHQDTAMFTRLHAVFEQRSRAGLTPQQQRLVERLHRDFERAGAQLPEPQRTEFAALAGQHAELTTRFGQNLLHDEAAFAMPLPDEAALAGLPESLRAAARQAGTDRGLGHPVVTLSRSLVVPFLSHSNRRDLRETVWRAWVGRGEQAGEHDNRGVAADLLRLRQRQAALMGHANYADFKLTDTMAMTRDRVWALLNDVWGRAMPALDRERALLMQAMAHDPAGPDQPIAAWDWRYWAEKARQQHYAIDDAVLKPYFSLPAMVAAAFDCARKLFGLDFVRRDDLQAYHPDAAVYEVRDQAGQAIGLFVQDNFSRLGKRSGAWMSSLQVQHRNGGRQLPVVLNNNNFAKGAPGAPALLSPDDVRTLFHEFGHGLHGLLSKVDYRRLSGTRVLRDFVELPSQLYEHWAQEPAVLRQHARHWQTGEPIPVELIERMEAASRFGQAYETLRYVASAMVDLAAHEQAGGIDDIVAFEQQVLAERGLPAEVGLNHRLPNFQHLFSGDSYAAGYYVYMWAEVLEADAFDAFVEAGDPFDADTAARLHDCILSRGDSVEPGQAYRDFRGRDARIEPMLRGRGLA